MVFEEVSHLHVRRDCRLAACIMNDDVGFWVSDGWMVERMRLESLSREGGGYLGTIVKHHQLQSVVTSVEL